MRFLARVCQSSRIRTGGALLLVLLQRCPGIQALFRQAAPGFALVAASPWGRTGGGTAATLGAVHALAGATQFTFNQTPPISATVGVPIATFAFTVTGAAVPAGSFRVSGLPPGLSASGA